MCADLWAFVCTGVEELCGCRVKGCGDLCYGVWRVELWGVGVAFWSRVYRYWVRGCSVVGCGRVWVLALGVGFKMWVWECGCVRVRASNLCLFVVALLASNI